MNKKAKAWTGRLFRLPDGCRTENISEYVAAWRKVANPICEVTGTELMGFDPGILLDEIPAPGQRAGRTVSLPTWFAARLSATLGRVQVPDKPLTAKEIEKQYSETTNVEGIVYLNFGEVVGMDLECFLDTLSELLTGSSLLMDIDYRVVGVEGDSRLLVKVDGDPSMILEF